MIQRIKSRSSSSVTIKLTILVWRNYTLAICHFVSFLQYLILSRCSLLCMYLSRYTSLAIINKSVVEFTELWSLEKEKTLSSVKSILKGQPNRDNQSRCLPVPCRIDTSGSSQAGNINFYSSMFYHFKTVPQTSLHLRY